MKYTIVNMFSQQPIAVSRSGNTVKLQCSDREVAGDLFDYMVRDFADDSELLVFLVSQFQLSDCQMDGNHYWRFKNSGWPMNFMRGYSARAALAKVMGAVNSPSPKPVSP